MIYENLDNYLSLYKDCPITLFSKGKGSAQAHFSIINDTSILDTICETFTTMFNKPKKVLVDEFGEESFSEMVGLGHFMNQHPECVVNTYNSMSDFVLNYSFAEDDRYVTNNGFLVTTWIDQIPYIQNAHTKEWIKTPILHFHGKGKYIMHKYFKPKNKKSKASRCINVFLNLALKYPLRFTQKSLH
jgi:hypothetical protein